VFAALLLLGGMQTARALDQDLSRERSVRLAQDDAARRLDEQLKLNDPCAKQLAGLSAPGFKLVCQSIMTGGTTLGSTQLAYMVSDVGECASKCRPVAKCVAFSFETTPSSGNKHACQLFGATPRSNQAEKWISGVR
jgi:hypothetical protein